MTQHFTHMFYTSTRYESLMFHLNLTIDIQAKTVVISVEIDAKIVTSMRQCFIYTVHTVQLRQMLQISHMHFVLVLLFINKH